MSMASDEEPGVIPESEPTVPPVVEDYNMKRLGHVESYISEG